MPSHNPLFERPNACVERVGLTEEVRYYSLRKKTAARPPDITISLLAGSDF